MSDITRRHFLKTSAGAVSAVAFTKPFSTKLREESFLINENAKIYTIFLDTPVSRDDTAVIPTSNEEILNKLKSGCDGVDFIIRDTTKSAKLESIINEMKDLKNLKFDGVLIIGISRNYALTETGLPTIVVYSIHDFMNLPYALYKIQGKIITTTIDRWNMCTSSDITNSMYNDLIEKIKLIRALKKMKEAKILAVADSEFVNVYQGDERKTHPPNYNEMFLNTLDQDLGVKVTKIGLNEVADDEEIKNIWFKRNKEAEDFAKMWISEAKGMINTMESEVVRSGKLYLALNILLKKYDATAIAFHIRSLIKNPRPEDRVWPSMGNTELQKQGIVGCCQAHINVVLTHMLAQYAFGRPSMMGDFMIDTFNNITYMMHCGAPINPLGGNDRIPYVIVDHRERLVREHSKPGVGAVLRVLYPPNEPATIWRIDILSKDILVHTGTTISRPTFYKDHFDETMCRTKLAIKVNDAKKIQSHIYPDKYGVHRSGTIGDFRERIKDLGNLIGYNVVEEDV